MSDARGVSADAVPPAARVSAEEQIGEALATGDRVLALALCARHHGSLVGRLCMSLVGSQAEADDLLQETLLAAHEAFGDFEGRSSVRAWLCGIAKNKCLQHLEKRRRRTARLRLVADGEEPPAVDEMLGARRRASEARALLDQVRPSDREALVLRYCAELSFEEVAQICGIAEPAARKRVSRALVRIRTVAEKGNRDE